MEGLDYFGADDAVGFDYMSPLLSGAGGLLSGVAGGGGKSDQSAAMEKAKEAQKKAEQSASTMKMVLIGLGAVILAGGVAFVVGRR